MGTSPAELLLSAQAVHPEIPEPATGVQKIDGTALIDALRQAVASKTESIDSILKAVAAAGQVLTGATGIAVALRQNGRIVCRARSGEMAPELGATIDPDSGISGECVRAAAILMCHDTFSDKRVEAEVCRRMGVRSIAAVPLRGPMGMAGVLEAFSSRPNAFDSDALNSLRALSHIAEGAYARERGEASPALPHSAKSRARRAQIGVDDVIGREYSTRTGGRVWIISTVAMVLLTFLVAWWSWRHTSEEVENSLQAARPAGQATQSDAPPQAVLPKPAPATPRITQANRMRSQQLLRTTAETEAVPAPHALPRDSQLPPSPIAANLSKGTD